MIEGKDVFLMGKTFLSDGADGSYYIARYNVGRDYVEQMKHHMEERGWVRVSEVTRPGHNLVEMVFSMAIKAFNVQQLAQGK